MPSASRRQLSQPTPAAGPASRVRRDDELPPPPTSLKIERVQPSYVQVAAQLRSLILGRQLSRGERLPAEGELSARFGVSRSTTREALRLLAAENLIETRRGVTGGVFVAHPEPDDIEEALGTAINLTAGTAQLSLDEVFEAWHVIQIPAARLAAHRRTDAQVESLMELSSPDVGGLSDAELSRRAMEFHHVLLKATANRLLLLMTRPLSGIGASTLEGTHGVRKFVEQANVRHRALAEAIAASDEDLAERLMVEDLRHPVRRRRTARAATDR
jgi:GntR family transcriptional repressor for pyruvate dehydrogenase complex